MILSFSYSSTANALSATTANVIHGTAPYLTFDGGTTKVTSIEGLIGIKLSDGTHYISTANTAYPSATVDTSSPTDPIELPSTSDTFASVMTLVPLPASGNTAYPTITLNNLVNGTYNYWKDDDGDNTPTATGTLTVKWEDASGDISSIVKANPNTTLSACNGPYKLTVSATAGTLSTQYGVPPSSTFTAGTHTYHIKPKSAPSVCYAQPNLQLGTGNFIGPSNQWNPAKGFKVQDVNTPSSNFPTTGSNYLHFFLTVANTTAADIITANTAIVNPTSGSGVTLELTNENGGTSNVVWVTLRGPSKATGGGAFTPSTFKIYSDAAKTNVVYSFTISRWYIPQRAQGGGYPATQTFCSGLSGGYRVPTRADYTNSLGKFPVASNITTVAGYLGKCAGNGVDNTSSGTNNGVYCEGGSYSRKISTFNSSLPGLSQWEGGLFNEWGYTTNSYYKSKDGLAGSDWLAITGSGVWTSEAWSGSRQYGVALTTGHYYHALPSDINYIAACVSP